ncbi:ParA family protein [Rhodoferax saidenbachensis]|uniref:Chromosome partitioning protein n=1 Tax=Rhodoferax saidenbachensis TaxID=1484693 RepID=A0A1P8KBK2_9BURK|nr:ParA family protein [Rhodoferax saidenbachensis]APW43379.1 chromosome partitioning protein [Rhodoferax saidenbachensis]
MPIIAVINRKGGSGKSTMATHLAAWLARQGLAVMLGDVDRQQSTRAWLKRRDAKLPGIVPWAIDQKNVLKVPPGVTHVVLDTPGGMHGFELAKVVMSADAVVMPVCNSMFDRESAAACHAELLALPRVASGRCKLGIVGMRVDARTKAAESLREWALGLNVPFLGVLRETQQYVKSLDNGLTMFDLPGQAHSGDLLQWDPILEWLSPIVKVTHAPQTRPAPPPEPIKPVAEVEAPAQRMNATRAASLMPAQEGLVHGNLYAFARPGPLATTDAASRPTNGAERAGVPQFLLRQ